MGKRQDISSLIYWHFWPNLRNVLVKSDGIQYRYRYVSRLLYRYLKAKCKVTNGKNQIIEMFLFSPRAALLQYNTVPGKFPGTLQKPGHPRALLPSQVRTSTRNHQQNFQARWQVLRPERGGPQEDNTMTLAVYAAHSIFILPHTVEQRVALVPDELFARVPHLPRQLS